MFDEQNYLKVILLEENFQVLPVGLYFVSILISQGFSQAKAINSFTFFKGLI